MATSVTYGSTAQSGKALSKSIADVNPNVSNATIAQFVNKINALTTNTLGTVNRVDKTAISDDYITPTVKMSFDNFLDGGPTSDITGTTVTLKKSWVSASTSLPTASKVYIELTGKIQGKLAPTNHKLLIDSFTVTGDSEVMDIIMVGARMVDASSSSPYTKLTVYLFEGNLSGASTVYVKIPETTYNGHTFAPVTVTINITKD